jgi:uncharacterized membrane protein YagU involved in acid resistance
MSIYLIGCLIFGIVYTVATKVVHKKVTVFDLVTGLAWGLTSWFGVFVLIIVGLRILWLNFLDSDFKDKRLL